MSETKKSAAKRITDVAHPGKSPASATSKPVIVTNRPILQDPMVVESIDGDDKPTLAPSGTTIQPLTAPEVPPTKKQDTKKDTEADEKPEPDTKDPLLDDPDSEQDDTKTNSKLDEIAATKTIAELDAEAKAVKQDKPEETSSQTDKIEDSTEQKDQDAASKKNDDGLEDEVAKAEEAAKKDASLQSLVESKQYFLPINTVEKRRSKRVVIGGILLSLVLAIVWVDVALDAGLIGSSGLPHTHYFDHGSVANTSPALPTAATTKLYKAPASGLDFRYPSDWVVSDKGSKDGLDNITVTPSKDTGQNIGSIVVGLTSPNSADTSQENIVKYVSHQRLAASTKDVPMYERDIIYQEAGGNYQVAGDLVNDNNLTVQDKPYGYNSSITAPNGAKANFVIVVFKTSNGKAGFATVDAAKNFIKTADYQKARRILISTTVPKS